MVGSLYTMNINFFNKDKEDIKPLLQPKNQVKNKFEQCEKYISSQLDKKITEHLSKHNLEVKGLQIHCDIGETSENKMPLVNIQIRVVPYKMVEKIPRELLLSIFPHTNLTKNDIIRNKDTVSPPLWLSSPCIVWSIPLDACYANLPEHSLVSLNQNYGTFRF